MAADTVVAVGRRLLEKAADEAEATKFLTLLSGRNHRVFTGVAVAAILWRPQVGLFTLIGLNLLFEMSSPDPLMLPGRYLHFGLQSSLGVSGFIASPLELLLIFMAVVWFIKGMVGRNVSFRGGDLGCRRGRRFHAHLVYGGGGRVTSPVRRGATPRDAVRTLAALDSNGGPLTNPWSRCLFALASATRL